MTKIKTNFNEVTGATIVTGKGSQDKYSDGWDAIFGKKKRDIFHEIMEGLDAICGESVMMPSGLDREEKREFIISNAEKSLASCASHQDGDCYHKECPQLRDDEPKTSGRSCPLPDWRDDDND